MNIYIAHLIARGLAFAEKIGINRLAMYRKMSPIDNDHHRWRIKHGLNNFKYIYPDDIPDDITMLEFGTGTGGIDLQIAYLLGIKNIITVDITHHLEFRWFQAADTFLNFVDDIHNLFGVPVDVLKEKIEVLTSSRSLGDCLKKMSCRLTFFKELKPGFTEGNGVDLWYSESNLQRIPLRQIRSLFRTVADEMNDGASAFHRIDLADIHSQPHYPLYAKNVHRFDFLKHSDLMWRILNCNEYSSQNRLRAEHYKILFEQIGFVLEKGEYTLYRGDEEYVSKLKVGDMYAYMTPREMAVSQAKFLYYKFDGKKYRLASAVDAITWNDSGEADYEWYKNNSASEE